MRSAFLEARGSAEIWEPGNGYPVLSPQGPAAAVGSLRRRAKEVYSARVGGSKSEIPV